MKKTICILLIGALFWFNPCSAAKEAYSAQGTYSSNDTYVLAKMIHGRGQGRAVYRYGGSRGGDFKSSEG